MRNRLKVGWGSGSAVELAQSSSKTMAELERELGISAGAIHGIEGEVFDGGRMGDATIEMDPVRAQELCTVTGPFLIYTQDNMDRKIERR
jgi:hypothetical protein